MENFLLFIPLVVVGGPVLIVMMVLRYRYRQTQARYGTLLQLADKGVELPTQLLVEPKIGDADRRRALVLISGGIGLTLTLLAMPGHFHELWSLGVLPLMTGLGYLANWWLNRRGDVRG